MELERLPRRAVRLGSIGAIALAAGACSGPQVRSVANGAGSPAYELRADTPAALHAQAQRLCPRGYAVLRSARSGVEPEDEATPGARWLVASGSWLGGMPGPVASTTIVCDG